MRVSIIGTGYVGLVTGACLADRGHNVICVDMDPRKVAAVNDGRAPIVEAGLEDLLQKTKGRTLHATQDLRQAVLDSDVTMIAVGTPFDGHSIDLTAIRGACAQIGAALAEKSGFHTVVVKSTVVPGTTDGPIRRVLEESSNKKCNIDFGLAVNPEFLTEGVAVRDFMFPDRIVIGSSDTRSQIAVLELYESFSGVPRVLTNERTAEMIKYASNSLLATLISFSNEIADLCSAIGNIDVADVMAGVHASTYLTMHDAAGATTTASIASFLKAGCGFGGSCLPKDVSALVAKGSELGVPMELLTSVLTINARRADQVMALLQRHFETLSQRTIGVLGLAFKPDTDDVRESPAFPILTRLLSGGARVRAYDPVALENARSKLAPHASLEFAETLADATRGCDAVIVVTAWEEFGQLERLLQGSDTLVVDGRRSLIRQNFKRYEGIGA
jgi:UDPglucose 6-dehydrogenase